MPTPHTARVHAAAESLTGLFPLSVLSDSDKVMGVVERFFEMGRTKDLTALGELHADVPGFSSFSDVPPYDLKDYSTTIALEELRFASISDYQYEIRGPKVGIFGDAAVAAFELTQKGMLVDNQKYTGEHITIDGRATFVLVRRPGWKIVHIHLSKIGH